MKILVWASVAAALVASAPVMAQGPAYPTPDNNLTRSDDVDPADAPNLNLEYGQPSADPDFDDVDRPAVIIEPPPPRAVEIAPE